MKRVSAAAALVDILDREGVDVIFGVPGGPIMPLYDQLVDHARIRVVLTKHEQAAAYSAFAYARVSGRLGVCMATLGPGATNLISGLPVAYMASAPVLALTGQVQTTAYAKGAHQESTGWFRTPNQEAMFAATVKQTFTCNEVARFPDFVRHAIRIAVSGRPGPAHLIIPANLLHQEVDYAALRPAQYRIPDHRSCDATAIDVIATRIRAARFPILIAGERVMLPDATRELQGLAEQCAIPVLTDLACKSAIDEHSTMFLGCLGVLGHKAAERYLKEKSDLVITVGQTFNEISTLSWDPALGPDGHLIQLDSDPEEIGKVYPVSAATAGHLSEILLQLAASLGDLAGSARAERERTVAQMREKYPLFTEDEMESDATPLLPQRVVAELQQALPEDALVLSDSSKWTRWLGRYFQARRNAFVTAHDYEPMGWAVAGAIGAQYACPDRPIVCVSGDGAFLMSGLELATAAAHNLPIIWIIMNDARLGIIHDLQTGLYGGRYISTDLKNPDFIQFAASFGISGEVVTEPGQLAAGLSSALTHKLSAVFDVRFDVDVLPPARPRSLLITKGMGLPNPKPSPEVTRAMIKLMKDR